MFEIPLIIVLHNLDEAAASALETLDLTLPTVLDFCEAVRDQVCYILISSFLCLCSTHRCHTRNSLEEAIDMQGWSCDRIADG
mgnify:CR=1 FL=1